MRSECRRYGLFSSIGSLVLGVFQRFLRFRLHSLNLLLRFIHLLLGFRSDGLYAFNRFVYPCLGIGLADICTGSDLIGEPGFIRIGNLASCKQITKNTADLPLKVTGALVTGTVVAGVSVLSSVSVK